MIPRERVRARVRRAFDLADLLPVEARMVDTVIDATVDEVCKLLRGQERDQAGAVLLGEAWIAPIIERAMGPEVMA